MKINTVKSNILDSVTDDIERRYPLLDGTQNGWPQSLFDSRKNLLENEYTLMREPILECIPKYLRDGTGWVKKLHEDPNLSKEESDEMGRIVETLKSGIFENWELYPHQKESLKGYLRNKHVMVATGTGSGKTESFMIPMVAHIHRCAERNKEEKPVRSALKCLVLYPMNALVADQLGRLREIFGNIPMAEKLKSTGLNRYPRFGMYTSRAPFHGWYAKEKDDTWNNSRNRNSLNDIAKTYNDLELNRPKIWAKMLEKGKIPAKGFRMRPSLLPHGATSESDINDDETKVQIKWTKENWNKLCKEIYTDGMNPENLPNTLFLDNKNIYWVKLEHRWNLTWFMRPGGTHVSMVYPPLTPTDNEREYVLRTEMHQGGLRQFVDHKIKSVAKQNWQPYKNWIDSEKNIKDEYKETYEEFLQDIRSRGGPPDIMVTNYSMLEYMMLRPLEHRFWYETKEWLEEHEDNKLLFVIDEAHLYQGSSGTEVSMLIQRLRNVIGVENDKFQFILTSASLGGDSPEITKEKHSFIEMLTGTTIDNSTLDMPKGIQVEMHDSIENWQYESAGLLEKLANLSRSIDGEWTETEKILIQFMDSECNLEEPEANWPQDSTATWRQQCIFDVVEKSDIFQKLYTLLNDPENYQTDLPDDKPGPRFISECCNILWGRDDKVALSATDSLIEMIGEARNHRTRDIDGNISVKQDITPEGGQPLLPLRCHLFLRGLPRLSCCVRCGSVQQYGGVRCKDTGCNGRVYELLSDRGSGEPYIRIWLPLDSGKSTKTSYERCVINNNHLATFIQPDGSLKGMGKGLQDPERMVGFAAYRVTQEDDRATHRLHTVSGELKSIDIDDKPHDKHNWAWLILPDFIRDNGNIRFSPNSTGKQFHDEDPRIIDFRLDQGTQANHSNALFPQTTDMETRGDDAFSVAINVLTNAQDADPNSNTSNQGRKTLIFSDGRQRAAKIARTLSSMATLDETRKLIFAMLKLPWFINLNSRYRRMTMLYPWFTLLSASLRANPFENKEGREDQAKFSYDQVKLTSTMIMQLIEDELYQPSAKVKQFTAVTDEEIEKYGRISKMNSELSGEITTYQHNLENGDGSEVHNKAILWCLRSTRKYLKNHDTIPDTTEALKGWLLENDEASFFDRAENKLNERIEEILQRWKTLAGDDYGSEGKQEAIFRRVMNHHEGSIESTLIIAKAVISALSACDQEELNDFVEENSLDWSLGENQSWSGILLYHICEKYFACESLGIGYLRCENEPNSSISDAEKSVQYALPRLFYDQIWNKHSITGITSQKRPLRSIMSYDSEIGGSKIRFGGVSSQFKKYHFGVGLAGSVNDNIDSIIEWLKFVLPDDDPFRNLASAKKRKKIVNKYIKDTQNYVFLDAEKVVIEPRKDEHFRICATCRQVRLTPLEDLSHCQRCESKNGFKTRAECSPDEEAYLTQRIDVWWDRVEKLVKDIQGNNERPSINIFRTEEHTAQISEKHNKSDVFTTTELHELQFQDIPVSSGSSLYNFDSPPIDILSCTTTMEVGIDIGSLTAVALRTVPPHSSNYQQRVGRAGRGSASLSVAMTYIDNSAFAISKFNNPLEIVRNPSVPPKLYNNNKSIIRRHLNASIFQLFTKPDGGYDPVNLIFGEQSNFDGNIAQLMESLSTVADFVEEDSSSPYTRNELRKWLQEVLE